LLCVEEVQKNNSAFQTDYGIFIHMVGPVGMAIDTADYVGYIKNTIRNALDDFPSAYFNNISLCCKTEEEHMKHVKLEIKCYFQAGQYFKAKMCEFHKLTFMYLDLIISTRGSFNI
jgi:hypothetical protein